MRTLTWLHISDIHFNPGNDWKDSVARKALLEQLKTELPRLNLRVDLILCTGDIAFGNDNSSSENPLENQYGMAREFFDELLQVCGREGPPLEKKRLFLVPGNHDVRRNAVDEAAQNNFVDCGTHERARNEVETINRWFSSQNTAVKSALQRLDIYRQFAEDYLPHQKPSTGHLHYAWRTEINGLNVGIAGFNSAWTCFDHRDERAMWLAAEAQFNYMKENLGGAEIRIGLIHHPADWFNVADREFTNARCKNDFDFWLHGHIHGLELNDPGTHVTLGAGAVTGSAQAEFGYNLVQINLDNGDAHAWRYAYQPNKGQWDIYCEAGRGEAGRVPFRLPERLAPRFGLPPGGPAPVQARLRVDHAFPPPAACLCRGPELTAAITATQAQPPAPLLIHGFGGLGKTEIAIHYLLSAEARKHFGPQRYFVSVEGLEKTAAEDLPQRFWSLLATALFSRESRPPETAEAVLSALRMALRAHGQPVLLVLDNFETPVLVDKDFAVSTLDVLAGLAEHGLALLITLRDPLPRSRGKYQYLPLQAFTDNTAARAVLLHWANMADAILGSKQESALAQLLTVAEGWPIRLQMLGVLAGEEGLEALARRCRNSVSLNEVAANHDESDPHRHPHLSCALTFDAPQFNEAARSLLRALARLPTGVPEDWLPYWPDQEAIRLVGRFRLLAEGRGIQGETRRRLLSPMRSYLEYEHEASNKDLDCLVTAWLEWWRHSLPELFDEKLPRQAPGIYRDMHAQEIAAIVAVQTSDGFSRRSAGKAVHEAMRNLTSWAGDILDWRRQNAELLEAVLCSTHFASRAEAEEFAQLLAGSQSLEVPFKASVVEALRQNKLDRKRLDGILSIFRQEIDAWAWVFGSHDLACRLSQRLAQGKLCHESPLPDLLQSLSDCPAIDERIALASAALQRQWTVSDRAKLAAVLQEECASAADSALAHGALVFCGLTQTPFDELKRAVAIDPDYGTFWRMIAIRAATTEETRQAWGEVLRCADRHILESARRGMENNTSSNGVLAAKHDALYNLEDMDQALDALNNRASQMSQEYHSSDQLKVAQRYAQYGQFTQAAHWLTLFTRGLNSEEFQPVRQLTDDLSQEVPQDTLPILRLIHIQSLEAKELVSAASLLFRLSLPDAASRFTRMAALHFNLGAGKANNLAYDLLTRGNDAVETLALGMELAQVAFKGEPGSASAETLLCAGLRQQDSIAEIRLALDLLLDLPADADQESPRNLAGLYFDARRFDALPKLRAWLSCCPPARQDSQAWQALGALIEDQELAPESPAGRLLADMRATLTDVEKEIADEQAWRTRHATALPKIASQAEAWLDELELLVQRHK